MRRYYGLLDGNMKKQAREIASEKELKYGSLLSERTVLEGVSRALYRNEDIEETLKASAMAFCKKEDGSGIEICRDLPMTVLLSGEARGGWKNEQVMLNSLDHCIHWQDVVRLSAVFTALGRRPSGTVSVEDVLWHIDPVASLDEDCVRAFRDDLEETVAKFEAVDGIYARRTEKGVVRHELGKGFFLQAAVGDDGRWCQPRGIELYGRSECQSIAEQKGWVTRLKGVQGRTLDETYVLLYLAYRYKGAEWSITHGKGLTRCVKFNQVRECLDRTDGEYSMPRIAASMKQWAGTLKRDGMFPGLKVERDRITWEAKA